MDIDKKLIFLDKEFNSQNELFDFMADVLIDNEYVLAEYREKIKEREKAFPTGLKLKNINVAIPHADPKFTKAAKLIVIRLKNKIEFINAEDDTNILVDLVLGLTFENSEKHVEELMKMSEFFKNENDLEKIKFTNNIEDIYEILKSNLQ